MDLVGPLKTTPRDNKYIVTLTDYFSKWAEAAPLTDKTALGIANFIFSVSINFKCTRMNMKLIACSAGNVQNGLPRSSDH